MNLLKQHSILVVDDVPTNIQVLAEALMQDYHVKVATNGADVLSIVRHSAPDLILLYVMMPGMDGFEVCRQLKADPRTQNIPIIFVTASDGNEDEELGLNLGAVDYIAKPFHLPVVRARVRNHLKLKQKADLLEQLAHIDSLTGIANRRRFDEAIDIELRRCRRVGQALSLLMIDIDYFKHYNDHYGHGLGDLCLAQVASSLSHNVARPADIVTRYGGEEFAVILPETERDGAVQIAQRLNERVVALNIAHAPDAPLATVSVSIGVATCAASSETTVMELVAQADTQLYAAKRAGRNRTCA